MAELSILNVGAGDTKITFDPANISERIRSGRIIKDMLRRGYALLVEVERDGEKKWERAVDFDETKCEYIIADFDPVEAAMARKREREAAERELAKPLAALVGPKEEVSSGQRESDKETSLDAGPPASIVTRRGERRGLAAGSTKAVAVGRSAGG